MWISPLRRWADATRGRSPIRRGGTKLLQCACNATTPSAFQNSSALPADRYSYKAQMHRRKATESFRPAPRFYRFLPLCLFVNWKGSFRGDLNFAKSNIELSCAAESAKYKQFYGHSATDRCDLRRQLQRFVMLHFFHFRPNSFFDSSILIASLTLLSIVSCFFAVVIHMM